MGQTLESGLRLYYNVPYFYSLSEGLTQLSCFLRHFCDLAKPYSS